MLATEAPSGKFQQTRVAHCRVHFLVPMKVRLVKAAVMKKDTKAPFVKFSLIRIFTCLGNHRQHTNAQPTYLWEIFSSVLFAFRLNPCTFFDLKVKLS